MTDPLLGVVGQAHRLPIDKSMATEAKAANQVSNRIANGFFNFSTGW